MSSSPNTVHFASVPNAPRPAGKFSSAIRSGSHIFVSGWMGQDPSTGEIVAGGIEAQTRQTIANIRACLEAAGSSLGKVVSRRLFVVDRAEARTVGAIWAEMVGEPYPVSTLIGVSWLAIEGAKVEIEVVAEA